MDEGGLPIVITRGSPLKSCCFKQFVNTTAVNNCIGGHYVNVFDSLVKGKQVIEEDLCRDRENVLHLPSPCTFPDDDNHDR